jgi:fructose-bisphosphate aldolase class 1
MNPTVIAVGGMILYHETIRQQTQEGIPVASCTAACTTPKRSLSIRVSGLDSRRYRARAAAATS